MGKFILMSVLLLNTFLYGQENNRYFFQYNRIDYFAPAGPYSPSQSKILKNNTYINIDLNLSKVSILTYFSNEPNESVYEIKNISQLQNNSYFRFTCQASNYAEVIIDIEKSGEWIKRTIPHNGIYHKYYNY